MRRSVILPWVFSFVLTVLMVEIVLRFIDFPFLINPTQSSIFWKESSELGWERLPNIQNVYTNGFFSGHFTSDKYGNRLNSQTGTYVEGYKNILFIGDSTTASLEVDDDQTVPALLESMLRKRGGRYNVINLGVRGYGTDQSVRKAIRFAEIYRPEHVIYMYFDNDIYNNNTLRKPGRRFGKGVYIRKSGADQYVPHNYPVPQYPQDYASIVVFDKECDASVYETIITTGDDGLLESIKSWSREHLYLYRALHYIYRGRRQNLDMTGRTDFDPYKTLVGNGDEWHPHVRLAYEDNGLVRRRCGDYFNQQLEFLLGELRTKIGSMQGLHLVQFPDVVTIDLISQGKGSNNVSLFEELLNNGVIDSYLNLPELVISKGVDINRFRCEGDPHFCLNGNKWLAKNIIEKFQFN